MDEIKYLPADKISKIEISNISGSSYSAMIQGGIIRIDLRKLHDGNYFGSGDLYAFAYDNKFGTSISAPVYSKRGKFSIYNFLKASYVYEETIAGANAEYINEGYGIDIENTSYLKKQICQGRIQSCLRHKQVPGHRNRSRSAWKFRIIVQHSKFRFQGNNGECIGHAV